MEAQLVREKLLRVPLNDKEDNDFRKFCNSIGAQRAPYVRQLMLQAMQLPHRSGQDRRKEWAAHGHVVRCPGKAGMRSKRLLL